MLPFADAAETLIEMHDLFLAAGGTFAAMLLDTNTNHGLLSIKQSAFI